jgi:RnfABCDGE-type electron transport complex B subunit
MEILIPLITMGLLGLIFSTGLVLAYKKLRVEENPLIAKVEEILPGVNCGACGCSGCRAYAQAVVEGKAEANLCSVGGEEIAQEIGRLLGIEVTETVKKIARVLCQGTLALAKFKGKYRGIISCYAAQIVAGGNKLCEYGCLGLGDCVRACPFDAIYIGKEGLPIIIEENCVACGKCVDACPRGIIEILPNFQKVIVFCRNKDKGSLARKLCERACLGCGICSRACPEGIKLEDNLAVVFNPLNLGEECLSKIEKCPTKAIRMIENERERNSSR